MKSGRFRIIIAAFLIIAAIACPEVLAKNYERIVSLSPSVTEILFTIGAQDKVAGVTTFCDYPKDARLKPKVGGFTDHNLEAIMAVKPDLIVLTPNRGSKFTYEKLKQIKIETLVLPLYGLQDLFDAYRILGEKAALPEPAAKLSQELSDAVRDAKLKAPANRSLKIVFVNWQTPLVIAGKGSLENDLIELTGALNVAGESRDRYPHWGIEGLFKYDPDIIIDASRHGRNMTIENQKETVKKFWRQYATLRALRNGNLYMFKENVYSVAGPRTTRLVRALTDMVNQFGKESQSEYYERIGI